MCYLYVYLLGSYLSKYWENKVSIVIFSSPNWKDLGLRFIGDIVCGINCPNLFIYILSTMSIFRAYVFRKYSHVLYFEIGFSHSLRISSDSDSSMHSSFRFFWFSICTLVDQPHSVQLLFCENLMDTLWWIENNIFILVGELAMKDNSLLLQILQVSSTWSIRNATNSSDIKPVTFRRLFSNRTTFLCVR